MSDRYRLARHVATGGMAEVFVGVSLGAEGFEKPVAVKRMLPHLTRNAAIARMFLSEAKLATHLHHQNIVQVIDVGRNDDGLFIVMELVNGWDLSEVLVRATELGTRVPPALAAFIASQVAAGLTHAYRKTLDGRPILVAHRDVSPANILLSTEGEVKIGDFGIARLDATSTGTDPGTFKGKLAYAAPEVLRGQSATSAADQFSLGVAIYEMVAGRHPFGNPDNLSAYLNQVQTAVPASLDLIAPGLATVVATALEKDPAHRFPTPDAMARGLAEYLARVGVPATSAELASFLGSLGLPAPFGERAGTEVAKDLLIGAQGVARAELASPEAKAPGPPALPLTFGEFAFDPEWKPAGPSLSASGKIEPGPGLGAPSHSSHLDGNLDDWTTEPAWVDPTAPLSWAELGQEDAKAPQGSGSPSPPPSGAWEQSQVAASPKRERTVSTELELARDLSPRPVSDADFAIDPGPPPRAGPGAGRTLMLLLTLLVLGGFGTLLAWPELKPRVLPLLAPYLKQLETTQLFGKAKGEAVLYVDSEPSGATVRINGRDLGQTPLVQENDFVGEVEVQLVLKGYRPYQARFRGGVAAEVRANLQRR